MRRTSKKRQVALRVYNRERVAFLAEHDVCERCMTARSDDVHHKAGRGHLLNDVSLWVALCRQCHRHLTEHPAEAYDQGWSVRRIGGVA